MVYGLDVGLFVLFMRTHGTKFKSKLFRNQTVVVVKIKLKPVFASESCCADY